MSADAWEKVMIARMAKRPTALAYIERLFTDFTELHGDRLFRDDPAMVCGVAFFGDIPVTVIAQEKGNGVKEKAMRNFGSPYPEGYRKALRLMKQAQKFNRPIISIVDTQGAFCDVGAEERGQGRAIAANLFEMIKLRVPFISFFIGEGGSGGALAIAVADRIYMLENAIYSILSPEGFASILWKDSSRMEEAASVMKITADELFRMGIIDGVIDEPSGGAQNDVDLVTDRMRRIIDDELKRYLNMDTQKMLDLRYERFRKFGSDVIKL